MSKKSLIMGTLILFVLSFFSFSILQGKTEAASQGWLGIYIQDISTELMEAMDLSSLKGILVNKVVDNSPADDGGIERGDVIVEFNDQRVVDTGQFIKLVRKTKPDDAVNITVIRDGDKKIIQVKMGKGKESDTYLKIDSDKFTVKKPKSEKSKIRIFGFGESTQGKIGVTLWDLNEQLGEYFGVKDGEGALITELDEDGTGYKAGLSAGDVILKMDGNKIEDKSDVSELLADKEEGDEVKVEVLRKGLRKTFAVDVQEDESQLSYFFKNFDDKLITIPSLPYREPSIEKYRIAQPEEEGLREELENLKEELQDLKKEVERLKDKL